MLDSETTSEEQESREKQWLREGPKHRKTDIRLDVYQFCLDMIEAVKWFFSQRSVAVQKHQPRVVNMDFASEWMRAANGPQRDLEKATQMLNGGATVERIWMEGDKGK